METVKEHPKQEKLYQNEVEWCHNEFQKISKQETALGKQSLAITPQMETVIHPLKDLRDATEIAMFQILAREHTEEPVSSSKAASYFNIGRDSESHTTPLLRSLR
jgi:hypothetical protein